MLKTDQTNKTPKAPNHGETLQEQRSFAVQPGTAAASLTQRPTRHSGSWTVLPGTSLSPGPQGQLLLLTPFKKKN